MSEETNSVRCVAAYNKTLLGGKFERGRSVWIDPAGVRLLCSLLQPHMAVLEFGSGGSTSLFSQFVRRWHSVEHNKWWANKVIWLRLSHIIEYNVLLLYR